MKTKQPKAPEARQGDDPLALEVEGLTYRLDRVPPRNGKKAVVTVKLAESADPPLVDAAYLYSHRQRHALAVLVADTFGRQPGDVLGHLALLLDQVERASPQDRNPASVVLTAARKTAAEKLLCARDLLDRATQVLSELGYVGEPENKRLVYLVATSRLLEHPLSAVLRAESASGKTELLDQIARMLPPESVEFLSRLTPMALYYAGADHLRHKLVVVDEQAGASEADYAIRTLQSRGVLKLAVPVKGRTESFEARGPIALLSGTTRDDLNPENLSRCLELKLDDSPEQTRRVQEAQRRAWAGERARGTSANLELWQDAQRLLEPVEVRIPFAERLTFPARTTTDRRNNQMLLTLVAAHALLLQRQRERDREARVLATPDDYSAVHGLLAPLFERGIDGLSPRGTTLYRAFSASDRPALTRFDAAKLLGWSYSTARRALDELVQHELVRRVGHDVPRRYGLVNASLGASAVALTSPDDLE